MTSPSSAEIDDLTAQLARLAQAGMPLGPGLRAAAAELPSRRSARAMGKLADALDRGQPLDEAIAALGPHLPPHLRGLLVAGLRSGRLESLLDQHVASQQRTAALRRELWLTLSYPALLLAMSFALLLFLSVNVVGVSAELGAGFDTELPEQTQFVLTVAKFGWGLPALLSLMALLAVAAFALFGGEFASRAAFRLPLVGPLFRCSALGGFARTLSLLLEGAVPLPEALRLASLGTPNLGASQACERLAQRVEAGDDLLPALAAEPGLAPTLSATVRWGQGLPALASSLQIAAAAFERRAAAQLRVIRAVAAPVAFLFVAGAILMMLSAVVSPMIKLLETLT